jgi:hypothetical protein
MGTSHSSQSPPPPPRTPVAGVGAFWAHPGKADEGTARERRSSAGRRGLWNRVVEGIGRPEEEGGEASWWTGGRGPARGGLRGGGRFLIVSP